jgi:transcriptional regulator with XRE-family HTH domain
MIKCGEKITFLRERNGLTQEELANKLGISRSALSHYEKNRREPEFKTLNDIADLFDVSVDYLFGRTQHLSESISPQFDS